MIDWLVPVACSLIAFGGAVYATRGKRATDRGDLADRLWDQLQEGDALLQRERRAHQAREKAWMDYATRLRRQVVSAGIDPEPYPTDLLT